MVVYYSFSQVVFRWETLNQILVWSVFSALLWFIFFRRIKPTAGRVALVIIAMPIWTVCFEYWLWHYLHIQYPPVRPIP